MCVRGNGSVCVCVCVCVCVSENGSVCVCVSGRARRASGTVCQLSEVMNESSCVRASV